MQRPNQLRSGQSTAVDSNEGRIVWLAAADARGHLVRAHVMRELLAERGVDVDIFTTSREGVRFLDEFGTPAVALDGDYRVEFDERQNLDVSGTARGILRYFADTERFVDDFARLLVAARQATCIVNDFHPALLVGGAIESLGLPVVHLHGSNLWRAIARPFDRPVGRVVNPLYERLVGRLRRRGLARVVHRPLATFEAEWRAPDRVELPPLVPPTEGGWERRSASRRSKPRVAVYLNPYFRDPQIARAVEAMVECIGADVHAVAEGYADRPGWVARDSEFAGYAAGADLLVSAPGMGGVGLSRTFRTPYLMLLTDQPEQRRNARRMRASTEVPPCAGVEADEAKLFDVLSGRAAALLQKSSDGGESRLDDLHRVWRRAFVELVDRLERRRARAA